MPRRRAAAASRSPSRRRTDRSTVPHTYLPLILISRGGERPGGRLDAPSPCPRGGQRTCCSAAAAHRPRRAATAASATATANAQRQAAAVYGAGGRVRRTSSRHSGGASRGSPPLPERSSRAGGAFRTDKGARGMHAPHDAFIGVAAFTLQLLGFSALQSRLARGCGRFLVQRGQPTKTSKSRSSVQRRCRRRAEGRACGARCVRPV